MRRAYLSVALAAGLGLLALSGARASEAPKWSMNASIIEACSCPMFCQCYFNDKPAAHGHAGHAGHGEGEHFCRFNNAFKVNKGHYGAVKLDGAQFWVAGDLGGDFSSGKMDWAVVTFDKATTPEQREAIGAILAALYPVEWGSLTTAEGEMTWQASTTSARAALDGGKTAEVVLKHPVAAAADDAQPVVIKNLQYWGATSNDGFVLMPNEVVAYRNGDKAFEYKGTNGFMITFDVDSASAAARMAAAGKR